MPGGVKNWASGQTLDAADLNEYIANQVIARFPTIAARTAAYGVSGAPSLQVGLFAYVESTELLYYYDGTSWSEVGAQVDDGEITEAKLANNSVTSAKIVDGTIVNADISSSAAIEISKIADVTIDTKTANYTLVLTDKNKFIEMNLSSANTISVPTNAAVAFPIGSQINITQYGAGKTQIVAVTPATTTIRSTPGTFLRAQYSSATLIKRATDEWYLVGDLSAT